MSRIRTRSALLPAALLLAALAACAGGSPTEPRAWSPRHDGTTATDSTARSLANYENPTV